MFLAVGGKLAGLVAVADPIKATAAEAHRQAARAGLKIVMATGDNETTAKAVAAELGIDEVAPGCGRRTSCALIERLAGARAASWRWPATASTTRRRWPAPMSASPWAPAPTWPWRAPG